MDEPPAIPPGPPPASGEIRSVPPADPPPPLPEEPPALPIERPGSSLFSGLIETAGLLLSTPRTAYRRMTLTASLARPLVFGLIFGIIGVWGQTFWDAFVRDWLPDFLPFADSDIPVALPWLTALMAPLWYPILLLVGSGIVHLCLMLVGGARRGFGATLRTNCYATAPLPLSWIPMCGQLASGIWSLVLLVVGLSTVHGIGLSRSAAAVLLPILLCCGCGLLALTLFGVAIFGAAR